MPLDPSPSIPSTQLYYPSLARDILNPQNQRVPIPLLLPMMMRRSKRRKRDSHPKHALSESLNQEVSIPQSRLGLSVVPRRLRSRLRILRILQTALPP
ncbi:hypothetical protein H0H93_004651, partial [Arthromyces matolae]